MAEVQVEPAPMVTHQQVWDALDALAAKHGFSASGLAKRAGLDPTTFNVSKRRSKDGKLRWPSTESIAKVLAATGSTMEEFVALMGGGRRTVPSHRIPIVDFRRAGDAAIFDRSGLPAGGGWDEVEFPDVGDAAAFALEITGDSLTPTYRDGDIIVVSPEATPRRGDRIVLRLSDGNVLVRQLIRRTATSLDVGGLQAEPDHQSIPLDQVAWVARILWASQ